MSSKEDELYSFKYLLGRLMTEDESSKYHKVDNDKYYVFLKFSFLLKIFKPFVPDFQRDQVDERVEKFIKILENDFKENNIVHDFNLIHLGLLNNIFNILDGQHRFLALEAFYLKHKKDFSIMITVYIASSSTELKNIKKNINDSLITEDDCFDNGTDAGETKENIKNYLKNHYVLFASDKFNPRLPSFGAGTAAEYYIHIYPRKPSAFIINEIEKDNKRLENEYKKNDKEFYESVVDKIKDSKQKKLFIGKIINDYKKEKAFEEKKGRHKIPDIIKNKMWVRDFLDDNNIGQCFTCKKKLAYHKAHCGHIISIKNNGSNEINNLVPTCQKCNSSIGENNMDEYCKNNFPNEIFKFPNGTIIKPDLFLNNNSDLENNIDIEKNDFEKKLVKKPNPKKSSKPLFTKNEYEELKNNNQDEYLIN